VVQQTLFNEHAGVGTASELLAWIARTPPTFWATNPWAKDAARIVDKGECFSRYKVTPTSAASAFMRDETLRAVVARDLLYERKENAASILDRQALERLRPLLSGAVAAILEQIGPEELDLPTLTRSQARAGAIAVAEYAATLKEDRPDTIRFSDEQLTSYADYIYTHERGDEHAETARSHKMGS
jgi:hypothetical protein